MITFEIKIHTLKGKEVFITAPIVGFHQKTGAPVLDIPQMDDAQWNELAERRGRTNT